MGVGIFFLMVIFSVFVITHMIMVEGNVDPLDLASQLATIILAGFLIYACMLLTRYYL